MGLWNLHLVKLEPLPLDNLRSIKLDWELLIELRNPLLCFDLFLKLQVRTQDAICGSDVSRIQSSEALQMKSERIGRHLSHSDIIETSPFLSASNASKTLFLSSELQFHKLQVFK